MKKRITCMLLVLCMVLAAVPTALAGQAVEDQLDFSLLKKHQANETQTLQVESVQKLQEEAVEPMDARASGYATYVPHSSSLEQYRMVGDKMHLEAIAYVPDASVKQDWNLELYAGAEPTEKGYVGSSWGTFDSGAGYYTISIDVDPAKLKAGTYTVVYFSSYDISDDEFQVVEDTVVLHHVYVTKNAVLMTRSFFADAGQSDYPEVTKICVARGFQDVTNYFLRFGPENTTDNRFASFTTSNSDMLEVDDFAGFLTLNAKQYGVATVSVGNIRKDFYNFCGNLYRRQGPRLQQRGSESPAHVHRGRTFQHCVHKMWPREVQQHHPCSGPCLGRRSDHQGRDRGSLGREALHLHPLRRDQDGSLPHLPRRHLYRHAEG